jgi:hypothetical protein
MLSLVSFKCRFVYTFSGSGWGLISLKFFWLDGVIADNSKREPSGVIKQKQTVILIATKNIKA